MSVRLLSLAAIIAALPHAVAADVRVTTDIPPIGAIVSDVVGENGQVSVVLEGGGEPHHVSLRASDLQKISDSDLTVWVGDALTPWLSDALQAVGQTRSLELLGVDEIQTLPLAQKRGAHKKHSHKGKHSEHEMHEKQSKKHKSHDGHRRRGHRGKSVDPHAWLSPENAALWALQIGEELAQIDPENAQIYSENADKAARSYRALKGEISTQFEQIEERSILWPHNAYSYFSQAFELDNFGAMSGVFSHEAHPKRIKKLRRKIKRHTPDCVVLDGEGAKRWLVPLELETFESLATVNPMIGREESYVSLIRTMSDALVSCLNKQ